jgi:uncharacterized membrane protein YdcZ (DUF606 family)
LLTPTLIFTLSSSLLMEVVIDAYGMANIDKYNANKEQTAVYV